MLLWYERGSGTYPFAPQEHGAVVKEMEASAVAFIADIYDTPMVAIKAITDIVEPEVDTASEFVTNFSKATSALGGTLVKLLDFFGGQKYR